MQKSLGFVPYRPSNDIAWGWGPCLLGLPVLPVFNEIFDNARVGERGNVSQI